MRWRVTITADSGQAHQRGRGGPGRRSGRHLFDQSYRQTIIQRGVVDSQQESCGGAIARMHDHQHAPNLFRCAARVIFYRLVHFENVADGDSVATAFVDEEELLRASDRMRVAGPEQLALEPLRY